MYCVLWYTAVHCEILWYSVVHCEILCYTVVHWYTVIYCGILCILWYTGMLYTVILYSGKISREKTFINWWKIRFSQIAHSCHTKDTTPPNFTEMTCTNNHKTAKFKSFLPRKFPAIWYTVMHCGILWYAVVPCGTLWYPVGTLWVPCGILDSSEMISSIVWL